MFVIFNHSSNGEPFGVRHNMVKTFYPVVDRKTTDPDSEIVKRSTIVEFDDGTDAKVTQTLMEVQEILNAAIHSEIQGR